MKISCHSERIFTCVTSNFLWHPGVHKCPKQCPVLVPSNLHSVLVSGSFCFIQQPLFQEKLDKQIPTGKTIVDFNEARDDVVTMATAGLYANYAHFSLQITMTTLHHSIFYRPDALPYTQLTYLTTDSTNSWLAPFLLGTRYDTTRHEMLF